MGEGRARGYGRWIAFFILVTAFAGGFGESVVPSQIIVAGNAAATATNIVAQDQLFRLGFVAYLIEAVCDVSLTVFLYLLLRPVRNDVALLGALLRLLGTAVFAVGELIFFSATLILEGPYLRMFTSDQLDALAYLAVQTYGSAAVAFVPAPTPV